MRLALPLVLLVALAGAFGCDADGRGPRRARATPVSEVGTGRPASAPTEAPSLAAPASEPDRPLVAEAAPPIAAPRRVARRRASVAVTTPVPMTEALPEDPNGESGWVCARVTRGVRVDPEDEEDCEWVRRPSCPGMFVVYHRSTSGLFGTCANSFPP